MQNALTDENNRPSLIAKSNTTNETRVLLIDELTGGLIVLPTSSTSALNTPGIYNVSMPTAGTIYSQVLPADTGKLSIHLRDLGPSLKIAIDDPTLTTYFTLLTGTIYTIDGIPLGGKTVYFSSDDNSQTAEIFIWYKV